MAFEYVLKLRGKDIPKDATLLNMGKLIVTSAPVIYPSGNECVHDECVGTFIRDYDGIHVIFFTARDFGEEIGCEFILKDSSEIFYLNGYDKRTVIEAISLKEGGALLKAKKSQGEKKIIWKNYGMK